MRKILIISFLTFGLVGYAFSQVPVIQWQKSLGGSDNEYKHIGQRYAQTTDGGYIISGYSISTDGNVIGNQGLYDYWILKLDSLGNIIWQRSLGGSSMDIAYSVQQTSDDGYIVAGQTFSVDGNVIGNHGAYDIWIVKLNASGSIVWQKALGGSDWDQAFSIQQTIDGGYVVAGSTASNDGNVSGFHGGFSDFWVVKLNSFGTIVWQKVLGGSGTETAYSIQQTSDGGYIVAGNSSSADGDITGNLGEYDYWVVKLDINGNITWQKSLGGSDNDNAYSIQQTSDGGYVVAGQTNSFDGYVTGNHGSTDCWIVKLTSAGVVQWQKSLGGSENDVAYSIQQTTDGGFIVAGSSSSIDGDVSNAIGQDDAWIIKLNNIGNITWQKKWGGPGIEIAYFIQQTNDGGYLFAGQSDSNNGDVTGNHGGDDIWLGKIQMINVITAPITPDTLCVGASINVNFTTVSTFNAGNMFTVQLSDANGSFATPTTLGSIPSTLSGVIPVTIPTNIPSGTNYRIRVVSSNPTGNVSDNGNNITINVPKSPSLSISISPTNIICGGTKVVFTAQPIQGGTAPFYQWKKNNINTGTNDAIYSDSTLIQNDVITCVMTSNAGCILTAISNNITMNVTTPTIYFRDADGDGYGSLTNTLAACSLPLGYVTNNNDCNDARAAINPGANEICVNGIDDNCNGQIDEGCSLITLRIRLFIEGYYLSNYSQRHVLYTSGISPDTAACEQITIELHSAASPFNLVLTTTSTVCTDGYGFTGLPQLINGGSYYIAIQSRTGISTWSKVPVTFGQFTSFDFSSTK